MQCWMQSQIIYPDTTAQSPARTAIQVRAPSSPGYPLLNRIPSVSPNIAFGSVPAAGVFQRGNPIGDSMQNIILCMKIKLSRTGEIALTRLNSLALNHPLLSQYKSSNPNIRM